MRYPDPVRTEALRVAYLSDEPLKSIAHRLGMLMSNICATARRRGWAPRRVAKRKTTTRAYRRKKAYVHYLAKRTCKSARSTARP